MAQTTHKIAGYNVTVIKDATIGEPQDSALQYIADRIAAGELSGELIEGRWTAEKIVKIDKSFKKITPVPIPDTLLKIKNGYKIAAATWVIEMIMQNMADYTGHLNSIERDKVTIEIDRIVDRIRTKRAKDHAAK